MIQTNILNAAGHAITIVIPGTTQIYRYSPGNGYSLRISIGKTALLKEETDLLINRFAPSPTGG